ncbi:MAG TPA: hypothetical protein VHS33_09185 [Sphingomicrobium sp.]|jgi:hypothetical protein|nr:hypothetical protein [Sphingomicrobium sp.]
MIAALLMLAQIIPVPEEPRPVETTIAAIRANPKKFDGQLVRLHGYVNHCRPQDCSIEERPATAPAGTGEGLSIADDAKFDATVTPLLPTYVEFDARLNAQCLISACSDHAPDLTIVTLRGVVSPEPPPFESQ